MKIVLFVLLSSFLSHAGFPIVKVIEISGEYKNKKGSAFAEHASYDLEEVKISHQNIDVKFNKIKKNLVLRDANTIVELKFDFDFLNVFNAISFDSVDIYSGGNQLDMNLDDLNIFVDQSTYHLNSVTLSSDITEYNTDGKDISILNGLLLSGEMKVNYLDFGAKKSSELDEELKNSQLNELITNKMEDNKMIPVIARYLTIKIEKGKFRGAVLLDSWINAWLKLNGSLKHLEKENQLIINLQRAKLGFFSIKGFLLRKVKSLGIDSVKVDGSNIIIQMENVFSRGNNKISSK